MPGLDCNPPVGTSHYAGEDGLERKTELRLGHDIVIDIRHFIYILLSTMANYYETARTNYFKVKDEVTFRAWVEKHGLELAEEDGTFAVFPPDDGDGNGFNLIPRDEEGGTIDDADTLDIAEEIAAHLTPDSVAVIMGAGAEKLRYVNGWAVAVNHKGETVSVNLEEIYTKALAAFGIRPTNASY